MTQADNTIEPNSMYVAASYVKFLESAGARVVPVLSNLTRSDYEGLFHSLNGLLLPGGAVSLSDSGYFDAAKIFFDMSKAAFENGDIFPMWGTCLGFQALTVLGAGKDLLTNLSAEDVNLPLNFTTPPQSSHLFASLPSTLAAALSSKPLTYNHHHFGITPQAFTSDPNLSRDFRIISTNRDTAGQEFVSTMEGRELPYFGIQWHSEKNSFEWNIDEHISHDPDAIAVMHHISGVFVNVARQSQHKFATNAELDRHLVYSFTPLYTGQRGLHFEQVYAWPLPGKQLDIHQLMSNIQASHME